MSLGIEPQHVSPHSPLSYQSLEQLVAKKGKALLHLCQQLQAEIDQYLAPLTNNLNSPRPVITGAAREIQMMDGITGDPDNWALAALGQPIIFEFAEALNLSAIKLHLYDADSRTYRLTVEAGLDGEWRSIADHSETGVGGILDIPLPGGPLDSLRITGLDNSKLETNPGNTFIHIYELELIENQP